MVGSGERTSTSTPTPTPRWSVFDNIKPFPSKPETLMAEIEVAISSLEYTHASSLLNPSSPPSSSNSITDQESPLNDARLADQAYKAGCVALASAKLDQALHSLQISLSTKSNFRHC
ncbi:hypothetical protein ACHQM5_014728 [Ranunculus cassubicifolius]